MKKDKIRKVRTEATEYFLEAPLKNKPDQTVKLLVSKRGDFARYDRNKFYIGSAREGSQLRAYIDLPTDLEEAEAYLSTFLEIIIEAKKLK